MVHPHYQYDPTLVPEIKFIANRFLTAVENFVFGLDLSEYHTGYRAFRRDVLDDVNFAVNSDRFIFDQEIIAQVVAAGFRIDEVAVPTRYFKEASQASFLASTVYGMKILAVCFWYLLHAKGIRRSRRFSSLRARYHPFA